MESMTGYGRGSAFKDGREITVELKAVNHRFLDISFRAPKSLSFLEDAFRSKLKASGIERGHIDVSLTDVSRSEAAATVAIDEELLRGFNRAVKHAGKLLDGYRRATAGEALSLSQALSLRPPQEDREAALEISMAAASDAIGALLEMRQAEGKALAENLLELLGELSQSREEIALRAPQVPEEYRRRLEARLEEWQVSAADPQRIAQEVALMADRCAIDEELSRLGSHLCQFEKTVREERETGKKLDFLLQEMNREVNTIGSKASDAEIAQKVVAAKCIIEKLREQVQNAV